ncbi:hypothetical protein GCM10027277_39620 [Pseudoduganella ginsengisoli]
MRAIHASVLIAASLAGLAGLTGCGGSDQPSSQRLQMGAAPSTEPVKADPTAAGATQTFTGKRSEYTITAEGSGFIVTPVNGGASVTVTSKQLLAFSDLNVSFDVTGTAGKAYRLYQAAFGRVPDTAGLGYWIDAMDRNGLNLRTVAGYFLSSEESIALYGKSPTNAALVKAFYRNVLGREPDAGGEAYWNNILDTKATDVPDVLQYFSEGEENTQRVLPAIRNGIAYKPFGKPAGTVPDAPQIGAATAGNGSASIAFTAPSQAGSSPVTGYTASCVAGTATVTAQGTASPLAVMGLANGTMYTCSVIATNAAGNSAASGTVSVTPAAGTSSSGFTVTSAAGVEGATMPNTYTCDGSSKSPPLAWSGAPANTQSYAVVMSTIPGPGSVKYNWLLYNIPASVTSLAVNSTGVGTLGFADDGAGLGYAAPCSSGAGTKTYTYTVYALSAAPNLSAYTASQVTGSVLTQALAPVTLKTAALNLLNTRTQATLNCLSMQRAIGPYEKANSLGITCDDTYAYFSTYGIQTAHPMMKGITQTILQVPTPQNFTGSNAWKIPLNPAIAANTTTAVDGPIGLAINGIPIFNPCKQGGCDTSTGGGDTKVQGELDICNGHAGRADDYHYHAAPVCMMADQSSSYWDTHPIGWALDGFAIFGYNNPDGTTATRDAVCGGNTLSHPNAPSGYAYHVTDASPYILSCFRGTPSPDLAGQGGKFAVLHSPQGPGGGSGVSNMTLNASAASLAIGGTTTLEWEQGSNKYQILYSRTSSVCWNFVFKTNGVQTATETDCRKF